VHAENARYSPRLKSLGWRLARLAMLQLTGQARALQAPVRWPVGKCDQPGDGNSAVTVLAYLQPSLQPHCASAKSTMNPAAWEPQHFQACSMWRTRQRPILQLCQRRISKNKTTGMSTCDSEPFSPQTQGLWGSAVHLHQLWKNKTGALAQPGS
jgi:hypothetical protein